HRRLVDRRALAWSIPYSKFSGHPVRGLRWLGKKSISRGCRDDSTRRDRWSTGCRVVQPAIPFLRATIGLSPYRAHVFGQAIGVRTIGRRVPCGSIRLKSGSVMKLKKFSGPRFSGAKTVRRPAVTEVLEHRRLLA